MEKFKTAWAVMRSKSYVVITDKIAVISLRVRNPISFTDEMALLVQRTALEEFQVKLGELIEEHNTAIETLTQGDGNE